MRPLRPLALPVLVASFALPIRAQQPDDSTRYAVLFTGRPAGAMTIWHQRDGARSEFEFNDRGRGPHLRERVAVDASGLPTSLEVSGHDYLKDTVDERFAYANGTATWHNSVEGDGSRRTTPQFYVSVGGTPADLETMATALLRAPGHTLALLPAGTARIDKVLDFPVAARGGTTSASLYAISGLGYSPQYLWLDADGRLLGTVSSWFSLIRDPYTDAVPAMVKVQDSVSAARFRTLARTLAHKPTGALVFRDANVFDAEQAKLVPHTTVVVDGNRIRSVGAVGSVVIPAGARVIDASGKTLLPGLWDMHVHVSPGDDGILHVAAGVTTARDMGNDTTNVLALKKAFNDGSLIGPRLELAGLIDAPGPYQVPTGVLASTEPEVRAAVDRYAALGFEQIKVYSSMKPELVPAIIDEAHKHGLRVSGHVPAFMTEEQVVKLGFDEVQHVNFVFLNFIDTVKDTRSMARFTAVGAEAASLDFHSARVRDFMRLLKEHRTVIDPTVGTFEDMFTGRPRKLSSSYGMIADRLPPQVRRGLYGGGLPVTPALDQRYRDSYAAMVRMVGELWRNGITIVPGTDATPGFGLHRELELWVQGGVPAPQVLKQATIGAARVMKHDDERGSITPGKLADLVLVDGDPTTNISAIRKTDIVVKDGVLFDSKELYAALGIH